MIGACREGDRKPTDRQADQGGEQNALLLHDGAQDDASLKIAVATTAEPRPMTIAQRNSDPVGEPRCGRGPTFNEKVPKPVRLSSPTKMRAPTPAESNPGTSTNSIIGPPSPAIS